MTWIAWLDGKQRLNQWKKKSGNQFKTGYVEFDNVRIYYEEYGTGDPLLLLHGGGGDCRSWMFQIPEFAKHFRVIAPDTRAHGRSTDNLEKPLSYYLFAEDWVKLLDHLNIERTHVVGWSDGGCTILALGINHSDRLNKIVPGGTPYHTDNYHPGILDASLGPEQWATSPTIKRMKKSYQAVAPNPNQWETFLKRLFGDMFYREPNFSLEAISTIQSEMLVIIGEKEEFFPLRHSEILTQSVPNGELLVIPGATHWAFMEKPKIFNEAVINFVRKVKK
ncbi:MAG: alpha/beta hydrolase [Deltaproteobacteria bacterium]|nr:alpha/beta hydrolase [Deltaproteobacteria bacterium]